MSQRINPTCIAHEFSRDFLIAASTTEDLSAKSTVVPPPEGGEFLTAVIAFFALAVRHPILLQVTVLQGKAAEKIHL